MERIESPLTKAWKRLKKNYPAMVSLFVIILAIILAVIAPLVAPDQTSNANDQVLEITKERPGFTIDMLKVHKNRQIRRSSVLGTIWSGKDNPYALVPINSYSFYDRFVIAEVYRGERYEAELDTIDLVDVIYPLSIADFNIQQDGNNLTFSDYYEEQYSVTIDELRKVVEKHHIESKTYRLGTDNFGRDILSRLMFGLRVSISVGFIAVFISLFIGITIGATAGFFRNDRIKISRASIVGFCIAAALVMVKLFIWPNVRIPLPGGSILVAIAIIIGFIYLLRTILKRLFPDLGTKFFFAYDDMAMWVINVVWSIPTILLAMALSFALGTWLESFWVIYIAVGLSMWVEVARIVRGQVMGVRELEYIHAARGLGFNNVRIIVRHILPNIIGPIMVIMAANFAAAILIEAGLSFIGIGVQPPMPSWGVMLSENRNYLKIPGKAFLALAPGISIMILVLAFNLLGNGLRDAFDVKGRET